jgi:recombination protein RecT
MNAPVVGQVSRLEQFRQEVLPPEKANDLWRSLPAHIKPAVFERNLINALMQNVDLLSFPPPLVYREVSKAAGLGLLLDPQLGEAYIVIAWNGRTQRKEPQLRVGYKGMCKLARQAGDVTGLYAHEVCERDRIECHLGTDKRLIHDPNIFGDRGPVVGYYAVIKFADSSFDFEPMTRKQTQAIRDRSDAWRSFKDGRIKSTPWATDEDEMAKKTVLRRLLKRQPQSPELAEAIRIEDEAEFPEMRSVARDRPAIRDDGPPAPPPARAIQHKPQAPAPAPSHDPDLAMVEAGRDNGEVVEWSDPVEESPPASAPAPADDGLDIPPALDRRGKAAATALPAGDVEWLKELAGSFSGCESLEQFVEQQKKVMAPAKGSVSSIAWAQAQKLAEDTYLRVRDN